jgi:hypothetical protein
MPDITPDRAIRKTSRRAGKYEPSQHIGLELRKILRRRGRPLLAQVPHNS